MKHFAGFIIGLLVFSSFVGCGNYQMVQNKRDPEFFKSFQNSSGEAGQAANKIELIKLLLTSEEYPIRLALYENGQFYYQVDELGTGTGRWFFEDGGLRLNAKRKVFDMNFYLTAAEAEGNDLLVKFYDRRGLNQYKLQFRNPDSAVPGSLPKLREFRKSDQDI